MFLCCDNLNNTKSKGWILKSLALTHTGATTPSKLFAKQLTRADLTALAVIGAGEYGQVYLALQTIHKSTSADAASGNLKGKKDPGSRVRVPRAVKMMKEDSEERKQEFIRETMNMVHVGDHDNVRGCAVCRCRCMLLLWLWLLVWLVGCWSVVLGDCLSVAAWLLWVVVYIAVWVFGCCCVGWWPFGSLDRVLLCFCVGVVVLLCFVWVLLYCCVIVWVLLGGCLGIVVCGCVAIVVWLFE